MNLVIFSLPGSGIGNSPFLNWIWSKTFGWTRNGVEYRLSAIPFGGYVALPQLADMGRFEGQR